MKKELEAHEFWYYFGKCTPYPVQLKKGTLPRQPYKRFNTKRECQIYINAVKATFIH